jgi:hypothetical protein
VRERLAEWLRLWADRIHHPSAPKMIGWSFTFERGEGIVFHPDRRGCPLAYLGAREYERAHTGAERPREKGQW